ncbi:MAG: methyltransferase domain-containing protein [Anaerolineae bacterium]
MRSVTPVPRPREAARDAYDAYDKLSRWYDALAGAAESSLRELGLQQLDAQYGERVLEIGFGTGHALLTLARAVGKHGHVFGIDISDSQSEALPLLRTKAA